MEINGAKPGTLYLVATPIGNLEDITFRAVRILRDVSLIAAEDTRHSRILLQKYNISTPLTSLYDQIERGKSGLIIEKLLAGGDVAYVSDAGTPGISDPGYILVREAVSRGINVSPVPGASALLASLCVSGLPMESFVFMGFLPSKPPRRRQLLTKLREEEKTVIFYESPNRLIEALNDIREIWGDRNIVVSRELTKIHEEFVRGSIEQVIAAFHDRKVKGEITMVVAGFCGVKAEVSDEEITMRGEELVNGGEESLSRRDAADRIAEETGESRRRIYKLLSTAQIQGKFVLRTSD
jgi:16S rRNA (cytidine1402-2'-O)-methyltransferase